MPNLQDLDLIEFLEESKIITTYKDAVPVFDEAQLCFDPKERLFIKNYWQEDLVPKFGISEYTRSEFERFFSLMDTLRNDKDTVGDYFFMLPMSLGSKSKKYKYLDQMTMKDWLLENNFNGEELFEYLDYCCRDDFGLGINYVSAWAGVFYFAARKHDSYNSDAVLTWPEGNGRLNSILKEYSKSKILKNHLAYDVQINNENVAVDVYDAMGKKSTRFIAKKVICCTPTYVNKYLLKGKSQISDFDYAPWFTATITLHDSNMFDNDFLCWDNVIYKGKGLGYIFNQHQNLDQIIQNKVLTYYYSFSSSDSLKARRKLYNMKEEDFKEIILSDLTIPHPNIAQYIKNIQVYKLGHGMVSPRPGFLTGEQRLMAKRNIDNKIYFAHSDLSGISVFEEAFSQGIQVVNEILD